MGLNHVVNNLIVAQKNYFVLKNIKNNRRFTYSLTPNKFLFVIA